MAGEQNKAILFSSCRNNLYNYIYILPKISKFNFSHIEWKHIAWFYKIVKMVKHQKIIKDNPMKTTVFIESIKWLHQLDSTNLLTGYAW